jgi:predicted carbohydrate-binding protein with CBM5 and CBM33 domain
MIRLLSAVTLILAAALGLASGPAGAQGSAIEVSGWERSTAATGTIYYRCRAATCAASSTVSYRPQQTVQFAPLTAFRAHHDVVNQRMIGASQGRIARIDTLDASEGDVSGARSQTGIVSDGTRHFSIVSTAPTDAVARTNMQTFLPMIMLSTHLGAPPVPTR